MIKVKRVLELLRIHNDKNDFQEAYAKEFPAKAKKVPLNGPEDLSTLLSEELTASINTEILSGVIWIGRKEYLTGLREDKLKRILGE